MVRRFREVRVWSRNPGHARRFAQNTGAIPTSAEEAVRGADVVVTVTHASEPVLKGEWLKPDVHVNAVGSVGMNARELDDNAMRGATVIVESRESAERESAEIVQSGTRVYGELGEILAGTKSKPEGKTKTIYKSLGIAVEDIAAAKLVFEKARAR
jgi:thiomorpholine-carboxylate dehydrogenase